MKKENESLGHLIASIPFLLTSLLYFFNTDLDNIRRADVILILLPLLAAVALFYSFSKKRKEENEQGKN